MRYTSYWFYGVGLRLVITAGILASLLCMSAPAAPDERELLGAAAGVIPDSIVVAPDGERFAAVIVDAIPNKRRVIVNGRNVGREYDFVAQGTPIFSPDGSRVAFVASRGGRCFVVVDGAESRGYEIVEDHWPVADLIFSRTGRHVAYKVRREGQNYLVVDGKEFGPYDDAVADEAGAVQGIWDFNFTDDEGYFSYRAKTGGGLVACRGWFRDGSISLTTSKEYESISAGGPVWLRGASGEGEGEGDRPGIRSRILRAEREGERLGDVQP